MVKSLNPEQGILLALCKRHWLYQT